jgi:large subunit ribosomal protein L4
MKAQVYNLSNETVGDIELDDSVFACPLREDILSRVIHWQLAKRRGGNACTKERGDVAGSSKKIVRQKGSGGARHGNKKAPQLRGGGVAMGPETRSHAYSLNKKVRKLGLCTALSEKLQSDKLTIVESINVDSYKTKSMTDLLPKFNAKSVLLIDADLDENIRLSSRNLHKIYTLPQIGANVYDIVRHDRVIISKAAVEALQERLK